MHNNDNVKHTSNDGLFYRLYKVNNSPLLSACNTRKFKKQCENVLVQQLQLCNILSTNTGTGESSGGLHGGGTMGGGLHGGGLHGGGTVGGGCLFCLKLNDSASLLAASTADCIQIWNTTSGKLVHSLKEHTEIVTCLSWFRDTGGPEDNYFYTSSLDKTIKLWKDFKVVATYKEHNDWIRVLALSPNNQTMISGCVSSVIQGWDVQTGKVIFRLPNAHFTASLPDLNTINSLQFANLNQSVFVSGARDGVMKLWDMRCLPKPIHSMQSHASKINTISISSNDCNLLSASRESCIRFWDVRAIESTSSVPKMGTKGLLNEYRQHSCTGYNVGATFFNSERNIVIGSEDSKIYIYDTASGDVTSILEGHTLAVHLVHSTPRDPLTLVSSSIDGSSACVWRPMLDKENCTDLRAQMGIPSEEEAFLSKHRQAVEHVMKKHGDHILKIFHKYNFTFSSPLDWQTLINEVRNDGQSTDLVNKIQEMANDFARLLASSRVQSPDEESTDEEMDDM